jgi:hypothetical protein
MNKSLPNNVIQFPSVKTKALDKKSVDLTNKIVYDIIERLTDNDINIGDDDLQHELIGIVRLIRAMIDNQYGLENDLCEALKTLSQNVRETTA